MNVAVIGLGKLGLATAAWLTEKRNVVWGYDINKELVERVDNGACPYPEPGLPELLKQRLHSSLHLGKTFFEATKEAEVVFIIVPTPSGADDRFVNDYVLQALEEMTFTIADRVARGLHTTIVVVSTVMPGSCCGEFIPLLEQRTGLSSNTRPGWSLVYSPEFIALGSVIHDLEHAPLYLIGADDSDAARLVMHAYGTPSLDRVSLASHVNAELAKLCLNVGVTFKMTFANIVGMLCEETPGADVDQVLDVVGMDPRVGSKYLRSAGVGFGGPCFPRDVRAIVALMADASLLPQADSLLPQADVNGLLLKRLRVKLEGKKVAVLGMTYKPGTPVTEESFGVELLQRDSSFTTWWDPAKPEWIEGERASETMADTPYNACEGVDAIVITTNDPAWAMLDWAKIAAIAPNATVVDCWRVLRGRDLHGLKYTPCGIGPITAPAGGNEVGK